MIEYLNEESLGEYLIKIFNVEFIHDKPFIGRFKPDYRNDDIKLIVEFDGDKHYTDAHVILRDKFKDRQEMTLGYKIIRWPYFVQMSTDSIKCLLNLKYAVKQIYPHGFIDKKCVCPANFCTLGIKKFISDLSNLNDTIVSDIKKSIKNKITQARFGENEIIPIEFDLFKNI